MCYIEDMNNDDLMSEFDKVYDRLSSGFSNEMKEDLI